MPVVAKVWMLAMKCIQAETQESQHSSCGVRPACRKRSSVPVRELLSEFWPDALSRLKMAVETAHPRPPKREP